MKMLIAMRTYGVANAILTREKKHSYWAEVKILFLPDIDTGYPFKVVAEGL